MSLVFHFTDKTLFVADVKKGQDGEHARVMRQLEVDLASRELSIGDAVQYAVEELHIQQNSAVDILLPTSKVYTVLLELPVSTHARQTALIQEALSTVIPEDVTKLEVLSRILDRTKEHLRVGVAAARKDLIKGYSAACLEAGLRVRTCSVGSSAYIDALARTEEALLLVASVPEKTLTVFLHGWPVDELLLAQDASAEHIQKELTALVQEYAQRGVTLQTVKLEEAFSWVSPQEQPLIGCIAHVLAKLHTVEFSDIERKSALQRYRERTQSVSIWLQGGFVGACFLFIAVWMWSLSQQPRQTTPFAPCGGLEEQLYRDVPLDSAYCAAIAWAKDAGVTHGYPDGSFQPGKIASRAELLKLVVEATAEEDLTQITEQSGYTDVPEDAWFFYHVRYGKREGIIGKDGSTTFRPDDPVTFSEALKMTYTAFRIRVREVEDDELWYVPFQEHAQKHDILFVPDVAMNSRVQRKDVVWILWKLSTL
ncbi:hypothetical protein COU77_01820 [Candidatus Peregrinibacteria bacterium CG10_big_fil_rev_8_21_14_0_10_49_16]|nr:MAG: hypothetical protein COU77_01820 [Candidatus Peregrinibacteria bacterium CG10_big_fil_rev_8_21_14_0_10_49_16]